MQNRENLVRSRRMCHESRIRIRHREVDDSAAVLVVTDGADAGVVVREYWIDLVVPAIRMVSSQLLLYAQNCSNDIPEDTFGHQSHAVDFLKCSGLVAEDEMVGTARLAEREVRSDGWREALLARGNLIILAANAP